MRSIMLNKFIAKQLKDSQSTYDLLKNQDLWRGHIGKWGGRYFTLILEGHDQPLHFKMKDLISHVRKIIAKEKESINRSLATNIIKQLKTIDRKGNEALKGLKGKWALYRKLLTTIRQIFGNLGFSKKEYYLAIKQLAKSERSKISSGMSPGTRRIEPFMFESLPEDVRIVLINKLDNKSLLSLYRSSTTLKTFIQSKIPVQLEKALLGEEAVRAWKECVQKDSLPSNDLFSHPFMELTKRLMLEDAEKITKHFIQILEKENCDTRFIKASKFAAVAHPEQFSKIYERSIEKRILNTDQVRPKQHEFVFQYLIALAAVNPEKAFAYTGLHRFDMKDPYRIEISKEKLLIKMAAAGFTRNPEFVATFVKNIKSEGLKEAGEWGIRQSCKDYSKTDPQNAAKLNEQFHLNLSHWDLGLDQNPEDALAELSNLNPEERITSLLEISEIVKMKDVEKARQIWQEVIELEKADPTKKVIDYWPTLVRVAAQQAELNKNDALHTIVNFYHFANIREFFDFLEKKHRLIMPLSVFEKATRLYTLLDPEGSKVWVKKYTEYQPFMRALGLIARADALS